MPATFPTAGGTAAPTFSMGVFPPMSTVTVPHNLNREDVIVHAYDTSGNECDVGVQVLDPNTVQLTTVAELPFSGKVVVI